ncbi:hypothetical protein BU17DRAFT_92745 [Hysterangium stoloniferum]|nr:hypothetical protein BU17DRAFT_92745 [Hysterangium stoloniferum]
MQKRRKQRRGDKPFRHTRSSIHIHLRHKLPRHALKRPGRIKKHHISKRSLEDTPEIEPNPHKRHHAVRELCKKRREQTRVVDLRDGRIQHVRELHYPRMDIRLQKMAQRLIPSCDLILLVAITARGGGPPIEKYRHTAHGRSAAA